MRELLGADFAVAVKDTLDRCLDRLLPHKRVLFEHLRSRWTDLFGAKFEVLLSDPTNPCFESIPAFGDERQFGYSRDHRPDCVQVVLALIVTPEGFPLAYEALAGNTMDCTTLPQFLQCIERQRQGRAHLGDGSRDSHRLDSGADARQRSAGGVLGGHTEGPVERVGETPAGARLAAGATVGEGQVAVAGRGTIHSDRESGPRQQGAGNAAAVPETALVAVAGTALSKRCVTNGCG